MKQSPIYITHDVNDTLTGIIRDLSPDKLFLLTDANLSGTSGPYSAIFELVDPENTVIIEPGDTNKNLDSTAAVWECLSIRGATRRSLLINYGGGMITDLGGFAAATFKRGIPCVNISTSLLADVDASIGGKTGINFMGLKNEIGVFAMPVASVIDLEAISSLPPSEILSGFGEIVKTAMLSSREFTAEIYRTDPLLPDLDWASFISRSLACKQSVIEQDPYEKGIRKVLNFGHTAGHAFESLAMSRRQPLPHGVAVAHGILVALIISNMAVGLPSDEITRYACCLLRPYFPPFSIRCDDYPELLRLMHHDKKNVGDEEIRFTLLSAIAHPVIDCKVSDDTVRNALDIYRDLTSQ